MNISNANSKIILCSEYISEHENAKNIEKQNSLVKSGIKEFDDTLFFERKKVTFLIYDDTYRNWADDFNNLSDKIAFGCAVAGTKILTVTDSLSLTTLQYKQCEEYADGDYVENLINTLPLYMIKISDEQFVETLFLQKDKIKELGIEILYLPHIECYLKCFPFDKQKELLSVLSSFARDMNISIFITMTDYSYWSSCDNDAIFYNVLRVRDNNVAKIMADDKIFDVCSLDLTNDGTMRLESLTSTHIDPLIYTVESANGFNSFTNINIETI